MKRKLNAQDIIFNSVNTIFMVLIILIMAYPFWYVLCYSLSDSSLITGGMIFFPRGFSFDAYKVCLGNSDIVNGFIISIARVVLGSGSMIIVSSMAAYVLSKDDFMGIKFFRILFLATMYFSGGLIPSFLLMKSLGLTGTFAVYILPGMASVFNMILIRTYIESLPKSLEESATLDGANDITIFFKIILPLCLPVIAAVSLFTAVGQWNSYIDTQIYNYKQPNLYPLQYILYNYMSAYTPSLEAAKSKAGSITVTPQSVKMAITIITIVPVAFLYPFLQRYFVSGLLVGSVKA
jgi:putative aldouronate transport system permease protein